MKTDMPTFQNEKEGSVREAGGAEFEVPKALWKRGMGRGFPPPQPTRSVEQCKLPQQGLGWGPSRSRFGTFWAWKSPFGDKKCVMDGEYA